MQPAPQAETGVYVYCVTPADAFDAADVAFESPPMGGAENQIRVVRHGDLAAIVSNSPVMRYTLRREYLAPHEAVVAEAMRHGDVLPVAFGSIARSDEQVRERLLKAMSDELHEYLQYVHERVELDLKVHWDRETLFAEILEDNPEIRGLRDLVSAEDPDAAYYERIQLGELTQAAIAAKSEGEAQVIMEQLSPMAADTRVNDPLTDMMILNAAFLVEKAREPEFDERVQELAATQAGRFVIQYVGPLPPYNFVTIRVDWRG